MIDKMIGIFAHMPEASQHTMCLGSRQICKLNARCDDVFIAIEGGSLYVHIRLHLLCLGLFATLNPDIPSLFFILKALL